MKRSIRAGLLAAMLTHGAGVMAGPAPLAPEFQVNTYTAGDQQLPVVARAGDGSFIVVWDSDGQDGSLSGIYARRYFADGAPRGPEFRVNVHTPNHQTFPSVAMNARGDFVVVWNSDTQDGLGLTVRGRRYAADGAPLGGEFRSDTGKRDARVNPTVGISDSGSFVVVWSEASNVIAGAGKTNVTDIYAQLYAPDGSASGAPMLVSTSMLTHLRFSTCAMNPAGDFVVVWDSDGGNENGVLDGIFARAYTAAGQARGISFRVSPYAAGLGIEEAGLVERPAIAIAPSGNFVVAWTRFSPDLSSSQVMARRFSSTGSALGGAFSTAAVLRDKPSVAMDASGRFAIAAHGNGIYVQTFGADGSALGGASRVDTGTGSYSQLNAAVAADPLGALVIAWQNFAQDGDRRGIFARPYNFN